MTTFKGNKNGFNRSGSNQCVPDMEGQTTTWKGRGGIPKGKLSAPKGFTDIDDGNRRLAKTRVGADGKSGTMFRGKNAFSKGSGRK